MVEKSKRSTFITISVLCSIFCLVLGLAYRPQSKHSLVSTCCRIEKSTYTREQLLQKGYSPESIEEELNPVNMVH